MKATIMKNIPSALAAVAFAAAAGARADVITDMNIESHKVIAEARIGTPPAVRISALVQTAVLAAVESLPGGASLDAAVATANRAVLSKLLPAQQAMIDSTHQNALRAIAEGPAKAVGIAAGEKAAADVFARRADDNPAQPESYRPHTTAGAYVPTAAAAAPQWPQRKPWMMTNAAQFRPAPPPALTSEAWAREFNEVRLLGGKASPQRNAEQTEIGRFWEYSLPAVYHGVLRSVALQPGRDVLRNARLYAIASQAMDDALIGVFDAKYHYNFWRPVTAIRNGDIDGNDATPREASWSPLFETPMHPEYPSAHSGVAVAVAAVIEADVGRGTMPMLSTSSPTAKGATRQWTNLDAFVSEVAEARIYGGIHFRSATNAGAVIGRGVGALAAQRLAGTP
jgi:PAP2 superfamily